MIIGITSYGAHDPLDFQQFFLLLFFGAIDLQNMQQSLLSNNLRVFCLFFLFYPKNEKGGGSLKPDVYVSSYVCDLSYFMSLC